MIKLIKFLSVIILCAPILSAQADDLRGLSDAFQRARDMVKEYRSSSPARPAGRNWNDYVDYSDQVQRTSREADRRLAEAASLLNALDAATRVYLEQNTTPEERNSVTSLVDAIMRLQLETQARQYELSVRVSGMRARMQSLHDQLAALDLEAFELRSAVRSMSADLEKLRTEAASMEERRKRFEAALREASSLLAGIEKAAAASRAGYWSGVGDLFARHNLGTPRDYTPRATPAPAVTQRRVHRIKTGPVIVPPLNMPVSPQAALPLGPAIYALPLSVSGGRGAAKSPQQFSRAVADWLTATRALSRTQGELDALLNGLQATEESLVRRATEVKAARAEVSETRSAMQKATAELNRLSLQVDSLQVRLPDTLTRCLHGLGEELLWANAQAALQGVLRGVSHHAELASHFTWVVRSYTTLLRDDLPTVVELLGPNPSEEALAKFNRLTNLTEIYVAERERGLILAQMTSRDTAKTATVESLDSAAVFQKRKANLDEFIRQTRLGFDPDHKGGFTPRHAELGLRIEKFTGRRLLTSQVKGRDYTWENDVNFSIEGMEVDSHPGFKIRKFEAALKRHLAPEHRIDKVFIDIPSDIPSKQKDAIRRLYDSLPPQDRRRVELMELP